MSRQGTLDRARPKRPDTLGRAWARPLAPHAAVLFLLMLALARLAHPTVAAIDDGAYALQADLVSKGGWSYASPTDRFGVDDRHFPIAFADRSGSAWFPYAKHPVVPTVMAAVARVVGRDVGYVALAFLGGWACALVAWLLASEFDPSRARAAFWLVASGPVLFNSYLWWAHAPAAATAGLAVLGAVRLERGGRSTARSAILVAGSLALLVLLRSEGLVFAAALISMLGARLLVRSGAVRAAVTLPIAGAVVAARLLERRWIVSIGDAAGSDAAVHSLVDEPPWLAGRLTGVWRSLLAGSSYRGVTGVGLLMPGAALTAVVAVVWWQRRGDGRILVRALLGILFAAGVELFARPTQMITGLLAVWPLVVVGIAAAGRPALRREVLLWGTAAAFALGVILTQYADGGGVYQWGGRFLAPVVVPLGVVAAGGLLRLVAGARVRERRQLVGAMVAVGASLALMSVSLLGTTRAGFAQVTERVEAGSSPVNVTTEVLLPRMMWESDLTWLWSEPRDLDGLVAELRDKGVTDLTIVAPAAVGVSAGETFGQVTTIEDLRVNGLSLIRAQA